MALIQQNEDEGLDDAECGGGGGKVARKSVSKSSRPRTYCPLSRPSRGPSNMFTWGKTGIAFAKAGQ